MLKLTMPIYKPFPKNFWENNFQQEGGGAPRIAYVYDTHTSN